MFSFFVHIALHWTFFLALQQCQNRPRRAKVLREEVQQSDLGVIGIMSSESSGKVQWNHAIIFVETENSETFVARINGRLAS